MQKKFTLYLLFFICFRILTISLDVSSQTITSEEIQTVLKSTILPDEVVLLQKQWADGIIEIGNIYENGGDYSTAASVHIDKMYDYQSGSVMFKPTLASVQQFRLTKEGALSYFIGNNSNYPEDKGFALKKWKSVRWETAGLKIEGNMAITMGNYYFAHEIGGEETKVEYVFAFSRDTNGVLKIVLHSSHIPYSPPAKSH